jgi:hypothetical protein
LAGTDPCRWRPFGAGRLGEWRGIWQHVISVGGVNGLGGMRSLGHNSGLVADRGVCGGRG